MAEAINPPALAFEMSEAIDQLAAALPLAQAKLGRIITGETAQVKSDKGSYSYKYADLADALEVIRPPFNEHGIAIIQPPAFDGRSVVTVMTMFLHTSGQWMRGRLSMTPTKSDPQAVGSAITYARRYSLLAMAGVATEDDDGATASQPVRDARYDNNRGNGQRNNGGQQPDNSGRSQQGRRPANAAPDAPTAAITPKNLAILHRMAAKVKITDDQRATICGFYGVATFEELTNNQGGTVYTNLKKRLEQNAADAEARAQDGSPPAQEQPPMTTAKATAPVVKTDEERAADEASYEANFVGDEDPCLTCNSTGFYHRPECPEADTQL